MAHTQEHLGPNGYCICVKCNIKVPKERGVPCREMRCPQCGRPMLREGGYHHQKYLENIEKKKLKQQDMDTQKKDIQKTQPMDIDKRPTEAVEKKPEATVQILTYKIAFPTNDGEFINPHFGRSQSFFIYEIQGKEVINKEQRFNDSHQGMPEHQHDHDHEHSHHEHNPEHEAQQRTAHARLFDILHDVDILIVNNLGPSIHEQLINNGYTVIKTSISKISDALDAYLKGALK